MNESITQVKPVDNNPREVTAPLNHTLDIYYKLTRTLSRNLEISPEKACKLLELPKQIRKPVIAKIKNEIKRTNSVVKK